MGKVLVTGATGFLGAHVVRALVETGQEVVAAKRSSSDTWRLRDIADKISFVDLDLLDVRGVGSSVSAHMPETVVHCAAYGVDHRQRDPRKALDINVRASFELLEACILAGVNRLVHVGSCFEYGDKGHPASEDEIPEPTTIYGATKAAATILMLQGARQEKLKLSVVRPFGLWGPLEAAHRLVPQVVLACLKRQALDLTACEQVRDYTFVTDMAGRIASIATRAEFPSSQIVNLGSGRPVVLRDFVLAIAKELGGEELMRFGRLPYRSGEMMYLVADTKKQDGLFWPPQETPLADAVRAVTRDIEGRFLNRGKFR